MKAQSQADFLKHVAHRDPHQPEYMQAVREVMGSLWPFVKKNPKYGQFGLLQRLVEPERLIQFRVSWVDDTGSVQVNRAFRVQHNASDGGWQRWF